MKIFGRSMLAAGALIFSYAPGTPAHAEGTQWAGRIICSYGSGSLKLAIDANGTITGNVTNGTVNHGGKRGTDIYFETYNAFGNRAFFRGQVNGFNMSGTYTQTSNKETCNWQASMVGAFADKPKSLKQEAGDAAFGVLKKGVRKLMNIQEDSDRPVRLNTPSGDGGVRG